MNEPLFSMLGVALLVGGALGWLACNLRWQEREARRLEAEAIAGLDRITEAVKRRPTTEQVKAAGIKAMREMRAREASRCGGERE